MCLSSSSIPIQYSTFSSDIPHQISAHCQSLCAFSNFHSASRGLVFEVWLWWGFNIFSYLEMGNSHFLVGFHHVICIELYSKWVFGSFLVFFKIFWNVGIVYFMLLCGPLPTFLFFWFFGLPVSLTHRHRHIHTHTHIVWRKIWGIC